MLMMACRRLQVLVHKLSDLFLNFLWFKKKKSFFETIPLIIALPSHAVLVSTIEQEFFPLTNVHVQFASIVDWFNTFE